jgi:hypothetical protein
MIDKDADFFSFPEELNKECTQEEFHSMMTTVNDTDIPIEKITFLDYPG